MLRADCCNQIEDRFARDRRDDPDERPFRVERPVEGEDEAVCGEEKRKGCAQRVARVRPDVEADSEGALHGALEADAQEQAPRRALTSRRKERPAARGVDRGVILDDARKVKDGSSPTRVDV